MWGVGNVAQVDDERACTTMLLWKHVVKHVPKLQE